MNRATENVEGLTVFVGTRSLVGMRQPIERFNMVSLNASQVGHLSDLTGVRLNHAPKGVSRPNRREMRAQPLTDRQQQVLNLIREHVRQWGMPPSRWELTRGLGFAFPSSVKPHLEALERKGWIRLTPGKDRGIHLLREGKAVFDLDQLPEVAAGTPILADESKAVVRVPDDVSRLIHPQADFYLTIRGDSMSCVGYQTGDIIAVKRTPDASDGDIVVARIDADVTVKCFHQTGPDRIELQPRSSNPEHKAIVIDRQTTDWEIVGVVVGAMTGAPPTAGC